ncbi:hypothetical protein H4R20_001333 [Coemansia guatemalensis]|uniref:Uncharacterized protein n=1 Tax=Coemansia guatemalensis TaxID=2761395 RepID=A0A9W8LV09_9FUNG|nr:hypothetical protein H4R20_001333 [Coemansia guatemalensis]
MDMFEKMRMLANIPKGSPEACTYFLCSLDRVVQRLLLNQFPTWIREGNLGAGYAFVNTADETFQVVTRGDPRYEDFHKFLDRSVQCSLHPKIRGYVPHGNQRDERLANGFGQKKASAPENHTTSSSGRSGTSTLSGNRNRSATHRLTNIAQRGPFRADVHRTEVEDAALTGGDSVPPADAAEEEVANGPVGQDEPTDGWDGDDTWEDNYSWDKLSDYGGDAYDVRAAEVVCAKVDDTVDAPAAILPAADDRLVGPWRIPVTAETNGESLATWAELDTSALRTLVSAAVADELRAEVTPAESEI